MADEAAPPTPKSPIGPDTLTGVTALARFEFEPGKGNEGTKILMVEWQDSHGERQKSASWQVSWSGKRTVFSADDSPSDNIRRVYFLLPPGSIVPPHVSLAYQPPVDPSSVRVEPLKMTVNPLPAIFTAELGASVKASGKKGVLHTIWAKKRMQVLEKEIKHEMQYNLEGIALEMATAEKEWIESTFGLHVKVPSLDTNARPRSPDGPVSPVQSPRSPGGGRLSEKLRGLSLGTSDKALSARGNTPTSERHPLSPEVGDMAYSSFSSFRQGPASPKSAGPRKIVAQNPPDYIRKQQANAKGNPLGYTNKPDNTNDGLFAVALSPRTPDIPLSPFSFSSADVAASKVPEGQR